MHTRAVKLLELGMVLAALVLVAPSLASQQPPLSQVTVSVNVTTSVYYGTSISLSPSSVTIAQGGKVKWVNLSSTSLNLSSPQAGFQTAIASHGNFEFAFQTIGTYAVTVSVDSASASMSVTVAATQAPPEQVQEFALIHNLKDLKIYLPTLTVKKGIKVRLFNTATDGSHPTVAISSDDQGKNPVFGVQPFDVEVGQLTVVEFTPDKEGEFFITHELHGHDIDGKLIVKEEK